jgi:hypothetical protein
LFRCHRLLAVDFVGLDARLRTAYKARCCLFSGTHVKTLVLSIAVAAAINTGGLQSACASSTAASGADPLASLIRQQTDLTSSASQSGDQATVDRLTSDLVLFSAGDGTVQRDQKLDANDALAKQLKAWTETLHRDPTSSSAHLIAANAMLVDERGVDHADRDFSGGAASVSDFVVHHTATVAVSSFSLATKAGRFVSVEIWSGKGGTWSLVAGQTIPLHHDPAIVVMSADTLNSYAGTYSAGPGSTVVISATADGLTSTPAGGKPRVLMPEAQDLFFVPGLPAGYLRQPSYFLRDSAGAVTGYRSNGIVFERTEASRIAAGPAPEPGPLKLRDFKLQQVGDVAVATFFHDRDTNYYGQTLHQTFQSMEAWIKEGSTWKMISSQGCQI